MDVIFVFAACIAAFLVWLAGCAFLRDWATVPFCSDMRIVIAVAWVVSPIFVIGYIVG